MSGGSDVPSSFPNCADVQLEYNDIYWHGKYANPGIGYPVPGTAMQDTAGAYCPWAHKNQGEIKQGVRHRWYRNAYRNFWQAGQVNVIGIKANQQSGSGRLDATDHITIDECIIDPFDCEAGIGLIPVSADPGFSVNPIGHCTVRNNYIRSPKTFISLSPHTGTVDWAIHNNLYDPIPGHTFYGSLWSNLNGAIGLAWVGLSGVIRYCRNAYAGTPYYPDASFAMEGGLGTVGFGYGAYWTQMQTGGVAVTCEDNVIPVPVVTPDYGTWTTNQHPATVAALGLTRGANGLYQHAVGSMLLTAANGGTERSGPRSDHHLPSLRRRDRGGGAGPDGRGGPCAGGRLAPSAPECPHLLGDSWNSRRDRPPRSPSSLPSRPITRAPRRARAPWCNCRKPGGPLALPQAVCRRSGAGGTS
jgi:hypothetical protein